MSGSHVMDISPSGGRSSDISVIARARPYSLTMLINSITRRYRSHAYHFICVIMRLSIDIHVDIGDALRRFTKIARQSRRQRYGRPMHEWYWRSGEGQLDIMAHALIWRKAKYPYDAVRMAALVYWQSTMAMMPAIAPSSRRRSLWPKSCRRVGNVAMELGRASTPFDDLHPQALMGHG